MIALESYGVLLWVGGALRFIFAIALAAIAVVGVARWKKAAWWLIFAYAGVAVISHIFWSPIGMLLVLKASSRVIPIGTIIATVNNVLSIVLNALLLAGLALLAFGKTESGKATARGVAAPQPPRLQP